jgi:hypothetical protein
MEAGASHFHISHQVLPCWLSCYGIAWFWFIEYGVEELIEASGFWGSLIVTGCGSGSVHVYVVLEESMHRRLMLIFIEEINYCLVVFELQVDVY